MTRLAATTAIILVAGLAPAAAQEAAQEADPAAGAALAEQCAVCHGEAGVSVEDSIPNLAAQKAGYLAEQLKAFRTGERENALMNAVAAQLSDTDIESIAAHFAGLPGAEPGATAEGGGVIGGVLPAFPADFPSGFTRYHTISFDDRGQVRHYWVDDASLDAAAAGGPLPDGAFIIVEVFKAKADDAGTPIKGDDGHFAEGDLSVYTAMQKSSGWGDEVPELLRNEDWRYAVFDTDGAARAGLNEGRCLACHKPLDGTDYLFTLDEMASAAGR